MSGPYAIARYLSDEDKQRILAHRYVYRGEEFDERDPDGLPLVNQGLIPVSAEDDSCPLAYLQGITTVAPEPGDVALSVRSYGPVDYWEDNFDAIVEAASEFIEDWDAGKITDLHAALGVER